MLNHKLVEIALEHSDGSSFEKFFQAFYCAHIGWDFVPLGGIHDGGADGMQSQIFERPGEKNGAFYQASIQEDHRAKIRNTVKRIREFGREPRSLFYVTSRVVSTMDKDEEELSTDLDVFIKIRDRKWIAGHINENSQTIAAFETFLRPNIAFLNEVGGATVIRSLENSATRAICVFLGQEAERRRGKDDLLVSVADSLILWALEGTDPDKSIFLNRDEMLEKILRVLPSSRQFIRGVFDHRLETLSQKGNPSGREIRWYRKENKFCLPYETRKVVEDENTEDEFLKLTVLDRFQSRAREFLKANKSEVDPRQVAVLSHRAIELTFEKEGLELAAFLSGQSNGNYYGTIADQVDEALVEARLSGDDALSAKEAALAALRQAFYSSTEEERIYFGKLSRTYTLLFTLRDDPKIVEYFKTMAANCVLYVGADIIIRALSERYLAESDQMTVNMLRILKNAGSTLILTDGILDEVHSHIKGTDFEFRNYYMELEPYVDRDLARHADKILIRAYFYAKLDPLINKGPAGWRSFIEQICGYNDLHKNTGRDQIRSYLQEQFGMTFESREDIEQLVDIDEVAALADRIKPIKSDEILAINDARQILAVYGKRRMLGEEHTSNPYGYKTWWLTHESRIRQYTGDLVARRGSFYIMRPEFILNFIALSPTTEEVRNSHRTVFPTLLGVRLSNRMREDIFHDVMKRAREVNAVSPARARVMMQDLSNKLKGDQYKRYEAEFSDSTDG